VIYTDHLVFLHLEKTAGTHIRGILRDNFGGSDFIGPGNRRGPSGGPVNKHIRPPEDFDIGNRLVFGAIRNPFDWYVSLFIYGCRKPNSAPRRQLTEPRQGLRGAGFRTNPVAAIKRVMTERQRPVELWRELYSDEEDVENFRRWIALITDPRRAPDFGRRLPWNDCVARDELGLMSFRFLHLYADDATALFDGSVRTVSDIDRFAEQALSDRHFIRQENLEDELIQLLERSAHDVSDEQRASIRSGGRTNASRDSGDGYRSYYDNATRERVRKAERYVLDRFGYRF
jgi:hypothetical protein